MAGLTFPDPTQQTEYTVAGVTWEWNPATGAWAQTNNNYSGIDAGNIAYQADLSLSVERTVDSRLSDTVSVKDFGAVGDGATDDTAAIQAAFDAVNYYSSVTFPKGNYLISSTINIGVTGINVDASSAAFKSNFRGVMFEFNPFFDEFNVEATSRSYMKWKGGRFYYDDGVNTDVSGVVGLSILGIRQATVSECIFGLDGSVRMDKGIRLNGLGGHRFTNNRFLNCNIGFWCPPLTADSVSIPITTSSFIDNNFILRAASGSNPAGKAFFVDGGWNRWHIQGGFASSSGAVGVIHFTNTLDSQILTIRGVGFEQGKTGGAHIYLQDVRNLNYASIKPVTIMGCGLTGDPSGGGHTALKLESTEFVNIEGCRIEGSSAEGNRTITATSTCGRIVCDETNSVPASGFEIDPSIRNDCVLYYHLLQKRLEIPGFGTSVDQSTGTQTVDMSVQLPTLFTRAAPKAYQVYIEMRDSNSSTSPNSLTTKVFESGLNTISNGISVNGLPDDQKLGGTFYTQADANGDIDIAIGASGVGTANVWAYVVGVYY